MRKSSYLMFSLLALGIVFLSACKIVRGSGDLVQETREVSGFNRVFLSDFGHVIIIQDGQESLTVEADDNIMPYVTSKVRDNTLYLGVRDLSWIIDSQIVFTVGIDDAVGMAVSGSGAITANNLEAEHLEIDINGSGDIYLDDLVVEELDAGISGSGNTQIDDLAAEKLDVRISGSGHMETTGEVVWQEVNISGSGDYDGTNLHSQTSSVKISGSGKATVWSVDALDADISGRGSVVYYGYPEVNLSGSGSGEFKSRGDKQATR